MPGGNIVVFDKLIYQMKNYEDLAALLSHEFTHVNNKHTTRSLFRKLGSSIFLSVVLGDVGAVSSIILRNADNIKGLNYSRSLEKEADLNGLKILSERKIDCNGFVRLFGILQKESNITSTSQPEWTNSHPNLDKRIKYVQNSKYYNENGVAVNETLKAIFLQLKPE
jgi:predicted Zn-dependent protease